MVLPTFPERKVGRRRHILKMDEDSARFRWIYKIGFILNVSKSKINCENFQFNQD